MNRGRGRGSSISARGTMGMTRGRYLPGSSTDRVLNSYKAVEFVPPQTTEQVAAAAERPSSRTDDVYYPATRFERLQPYTDKRFNNPLFDSRYPGIKFADTTHFSGAEIRAKELRDIQEGIEKEDKEKEEMIGISLLNQLNQTEGGKRERERKKKSSRRQTRQKKQHQQRRHRTRRHSTRKYKK
jgi:hypothetical protein